MRVPETVEELAKIADQYLEAGGKYVFSPARNKRPTLPSRQGIRQHCTITGVMVEDIGLLTVRPANVICVVGKAMKQETVNPVRQRSGEQIKNGNPER